MRYLAVGVGVLVLLVVAVLVTGWMLPVHHRVVREATYHAPAESLFALITNVEQYPSWRAGVQRVEQLPPVDGHPSFRETGRDGTIPYVIEVIDPDRRVVTRISGGGLPFGGAWTYEMIPNGDSTTLRITEEGEVYNPLFRFVSRFIMGQSATIDTYLRDVGEKIKRG